MTIHALASWPHYADHIAPIWQHIPPSLRGQFVVGSKAQQARMEKRGIETVLPRRAGRTAEALLAKNPIIVAGYPDLRKVGKRPVCFVEHGAGQTYIGDNGKIHGGYSGGDGRSSVGLFICPNWEVAERNHSEYPLSNVVAVGSPRLDDLLEMRNSCLKPFHPTLGISFHWECRVARESGSAFREFSPVIPKFVSKLEAYGMEVLGHGHPKSFSDLEPWWRSHGVAVEKEWEVVAAKIDAYMIDNSSTIFEAAALDIPVLLMESAHWRKDVNHGLRFWDCANVGPTVTPSSDLYEALSDCLDPAWGEIRRGVTSKVYAVPPSVERLSSRYAAEAIVDWL